MPTTPVPLQDANVLHAQGGMVSADNSEEDENLRHEKSMDIAAASIRERAEEAHRSHQ